MFTIDPSITAIPLKGKDLYKALFSMNTHQVATPEMGLAEARSYVFFRSEGSKGLSAYIGIYLLHSVREYFYPYSGNPFSENEISQVEEEARNFVEDLGAMLDEIDCARMSDLEKNHWIEAQEIFSRTPVTEVLPEAQPAAALQTEALQPPPIPQIHQTPPVPQTARAPHAAPGLPTSPEPPFPPQASRPPRPQKESPRPLVPAAETRQSVIQKAVKAGTLQAPQQSPKQEASSPSGVVSRDREALARLLTSF